MASSPGQQPSGYTPPADYQYPPQDGVPAGGGVQSHQGGYPPPQGGYQSPQGGYPPPQGGYQSPPGTYQQPEGSYQTPQKGTSPSGGEHRGYRPTGSTAQPAVQVYQPMYPTLPGEEAQTPEGQGGYLSANPEGSPESPYRPVTPSGRYVVCTPEGVEINSGLPQTRGPLINPWQKSPADHIRESRDFDYHHRCHHCLLALGIILVVLLIYGILALLGCVPIFIAKF